MKNTIEKIQKLFTPTYKVEGTITVRQYHVDVIRSDKFYRIPKSKVVKITDDYVKVEGNSDWEYITAPIMLVNLLEN